METKKDKSFIIEGNRLIAQYMGGFKMHNDRGIACWLGIETPFPTTLDSGLYYHKSWDSLLHVIHKIAVLNNHQRKKLENLQEAVLFNDINTAWTEVIKIISENNPNKTYTYYRDQKYTVWMREPFVIKANNKEEADQSIKDNAKHLTQKNISIGTATGKKEELLITRFPMEKKDNNNKNSNK